MKQKSIDRHIFSMFLIFFSLTTIVISLDFRSIARVFPLTFGIFTFVLVFLQFLSDLFPKNKIFGFMRTQGLAGNANFNSKSDDEQKENINTKNEWKTVFNIFIWLLIFVIVIRYVSYFIVVPIFLFLFLKFLSKETWKTSSLVAICAGAVVYLLFGLVLGR
ncbi:tripartite tricarboxylate transporter TctB family protein [Halalkalibacterium ligniniphilum]|uniref:tripartite tricarboxylate transporter TctB family protein n=1 Tax=Halalkalibacterium ligniniphilum TaxID=1134413 RepID=UPI0003657918|nr:tripartite tricarboxylate transporter TctB family protein [Halalkalibacterium ligniniphilum]